MLKRYEHCEAHWKREENTVGEPQVDAARYIPDATRAVV